MAIGSPRDPGQINYDLANLSNRTRDLFHDWGTFGDALARIGGEQLTGPDKFTAEEVQLLTNIVIDTRELIAIFNGEQALPAPKDFKANIGQVWSLSRQ